MLNRYEQRIFYSPILYHGIKIIINDKPFFFIYVYIKRTKNLFFFPIPKNIITQIDHLSEKKGAITKVLHNGKPDQISFCFVNSCAPSLRFKIYY